MKDRQVTHEGRRLIVPDSGTPFAATVYREKDGIDYEGIIEEGTPYNVENILPDTTAESLGLNPEADPTPADALQAIAQALTTIAGKIKYITATADINGDFYVTIPHSSGLAINDIVRISFPAATINTSNARLSIDGGTTYKNIFCDGVQVKAVIPENTPLTLYYDGTEFNIEVKPKKELWTGAWTSGAITVVGIDQYTKFDVYTANAGIMYGYTLGGSILLAGNVYASATSGQMDTIGIRATISGNTVTMVRYTGFGHTQSGNHTGALSAGNITKIVGIY